MQLWKGLFLLTFSLNSFAGEPLECARGFGSDVYQLNQDMDRSYREITHGKYGIRHFGTNKSAGAIFKLGSNDQAVILYHGFMASPPEMEPLADFLRENFGFSVYIPLLPGFAGHPKVANHYTLDDWADSVDDSVNLVARCFSEISMGGYSVGGGVVADYLLKNQDEKKIKSVALLAPFIKGHTWMGSALGPVPAKGLLAVIQKLFRVKKVSLGLVFKASLKKYRDLSILLNYPDIYSQDFAIGAGRSILNMTQTLNRHKKYIVSSVPAFLAISESDQTTRWKASKKYFKKHFSDQRGMHVYPKKEKISHLIVVNDPRANAKALSLYQTVGQFMRTAFEGVE